MPRPAAVLVLLVGAPAAAGSGGPSTAQIQKGTVSTAAIKASVVVTFTRTQDVDLNRAVRAFGDAQRARFVDLAHPSKKYALTARFLDTDGIPDKLLPGYSGNAVRDYAAQRKAHRGYRGVQRIFNVSNGFQNNAANIGLLETFIACVDNRHLSLYDTRTGKTLKTYAAHAYFVTMKLGVNDIWQLFHTAPMHTTPGECTPPVRG
ncbi:MAG: hypothetical protein QOJ11_4182 [Frankiales bacterium]|jgi:hypothetical protein|nr:hypothetical protein [Frankiales bacterium]